jgi:hypothetical protein
LRRPVDNSELQRWRQLDSEDLLSLLCTHAKRDSSFEPRARPQTTRWHCNVDGTEYELLCHGPKFYDTRAKRGGGGAVDLVMHLRQLDFSPTVRLLRELSL